MSRSDYKTNFVFTNFGQLAFHVKGPQGSSRAFIFLHGHLNTAFEYGNYNYFDIVDENSMHIFLDHRWHGSSTKQQFYPTLSERSQDIDLLVTNLNQQYPNIKEYYLVGYSQGGSVLLRYLSDTFQSNKLITKAFAIAPRLDLNDYLKWLEEGITEMKTKGTTSFKKKYKSKGYISYTREYVSEFENLDLSSLVQGVSTPISLIRGDRDELILKEELVSLASLNSNYLEYVEVSDCSHFPSVDKQHEIYSIIETIARN